MRAVIVGIFEDFKTGTYKKLDDKLDGLLEKFAVSHAKVKNYKTFTTITTPFKDYDVVHLIGCGKEVEYNLTKHRKLIGNVISKLNYDATILLDTFLPQDVNICDFAFATSEATHLRLNHPFHLKTSKKPADDLMIEIETKYHVGHSLSEGELLAYATTMARDLLNMPASHMTATILANTIAEFAVMHGLETEILEKRHLQRLGMGGILGVNQGSTENPKMITVKYMGGKSTDKVLALVGKGLTFDTGGYSLKPAAGMYGMHGDMGGAATVYGAFNAIVYAKLPVNVILVIPATDNMVSADAIKPGDVITMYNGKTVEVNNTDAEGRLILADALTYAKEKGATHIINAATLTGAVIRALGDNTTGAFTNNTEFMKDFEKVAETSGEYVWQLPIFEPEQKMVKTSEVADLKNAPGGPGAITAAAFLKEFVSDKTPWIHLDIAGTAETKAAHDLGPKGATGAMVRTLYHYAKNMNL